MDVRLVQFAERHLPAFEGMLDDPDVKRFTRLPVPAPPGFPRTWLARYEQGRRDGTSEAFAVEDEAGEFLGCVMAFGIEDRRGEGRARLPRGAGRARAGRGDRGAPAPHRLGVQRARAAPARAPDQRRQRGVEQSSPSGPAT